MDLSKLPKRTNDVQPPAQHAGGFSPGPGPAPAEPDASVKMDIWISAAVGTLSLLLYPRWLKWASSRVFGTPFDPFVKPDGTIVPYTQVPEFWADLGPTLFGVALLLDALVLLLARRNLLAVGMGMTLTALATVYNAVYIVASFGKYGLALASALAVIVGGMMLMAQWPLFKSLLRRGG